MTTAAVIPDPGRDTAFLSASGPLDAARAAVVEALGLGVWSRSEPELIADLRETLALRAQVDGLLLAQIAEVDSRGVAGRRACPSTRAWLRTAHRIGPGEASRLVNTSVQLRDELPAVAAALSAGEMSLAQSQVCVDAIGELPAATPVAKRPQAEASMIEAARSFDPVLLARVGRRLAEIIDPDGVQARDEQPIQHKEADAHRGRDLTLTPDSGGAGGTLRARLDAVGYATLSAFLNAVTAPGATPDTEGIDPAAGDGRKLGQRRCDGLVEAVRQARDAGTLPSAGGSNPGSWSPSPTPASRTGPAPHRPRRPRPRLCLARL